MTPEQFRQYHAEHAPRVIAFVRNATEPIWMSDILNALAPVGNTWPDRIWQVKERDNMRMLIWDMAEDELVIGNDLSVTVRGDDDGHR